MYLVAVRCLPVAAAVAVPAVWLLMASHASLTVWAATMPALGPDTTYCTGVTAAPA